jgi:hypothetical protein
MFIPDDVVGMEEHHFSDGNDRGWFAEEETDSRLNRSRSDCNWRLCREVGGGERNLARCGLR